MKTPTAVLIGFAMVAITILLSPVFERALVTTAHAQGLAIEDYRMISRGLSEIASAIHGIEACR